MTPEQAAALRKPFPPELIDKLPRVTCPNCRKAQYRVCADHTKARCNVCRGFLTTQHIHLDFIGHAETTDRLLSVDPEWTWEPLALDAHGLPQFDPYGGLWMRVTVAGVTRLGYGAADNKEGPDAIKEVIGDGVRNAAMRFGVALALWGAKGESDDTATEAADDSDTARAAVLRRQIADEATGKGYSLASTEAMFKERMRCDVRSATVALLAEFLDIVKRWPASDAE